MTDTPRAPQFLPTRPAEVGGIPICRALPQKALRKVGAWCFLDHAGPADPEPPGMQVGPHPHIGLQTFTWMVRGEVLHRDSLGSEQIIRPGEVNLMTAGRGIAHAEESQSPWHINTAQLWIALPDALRNCEPRFQHYPNLPQTRQDHFTVTLLVGDALGMHAPTEVHSPLVGMDWIADSTLPAGTRSHARLDLRADFEHAVLVLAGEVSVNGQPLPADQLLFAPAGVSSIELEAAPGSRFLVIGGEPMDEALIIWWNFVARTSEEIHAARAQWEAEIAPDSTSRMADSERRFGPLVQSPLAVSHAPSLEGVVLRASR